MYHRVGSLVLALPEGLVHGGEGWLEELGE